MDISHSKHSKWYKHANSKNKESYYILNSSLKTLYFNESLVPVNNWIIGFEYKILHMQSAKKQFVTLLFTLEDV